VVKDDLYHHQKDFAKYIERELNKLYTEDREKVRDFLYELVAKGYSFARVNRYMFSICSQARSLGKPYTSVNESDIKAWLLKFQNSDYSDWTKYTVLIQIRKFLRWLGKEKEAAWIKPRSPKHNKLPEEILTEEEIKRLAEAAYTTRDKAFILALYDSGLRIGEFLPLKLKHVQFYKYGAELRVEGKTGQRRVRIIASTIALQKWIEEHPAKNDPEAYLWCKIPTPNNPKFKINHLSYFFINRLLKDLAEKAGIKKKVNPHAFRHARATFMARHLTEAQMKEYFGWKQSSDMAAIYVHLSGRDVDNSILKIYGINDAETSQEPVLKLEKCPRCNEPNDPASKFCYKCGLPLDKDNFLVKNEDSLEERLEKMEDQMKVLAEVKQILSDIKLIKAIAEVNANKE